MKVDRIVRSSLRVLLFLAAAASLPAYPQPQTPQQPVAGKITALIPTGSVVRETKTYEAKKDMGVFWQDTVKTERGGRARLRLEDGSILNVGSQASLVVTKHDPGKQQTDLELIYGKVRADVTKIATPDGHFEIRTKVAVCGVVGTEEYLEATDLATTVIALGGGQVRVSSADPRFPGATLLNPGEAISIIAGRAPGSKRLASAEEMQRAVQDTEGESGATIDPGSSVAGRSFDAVISGKGLSAARGVSFSQEGLTVKTRGSVTATQIPVTISVAAYVPVGAYSLTIDRPQGPAVAGFAVASQQAIQMSQAGGGGSIQLPPSQDFTVTRGAKVPLDASKAQTPAGTQIVAYQWSVPNTALAGSGTSFSVNTISLPPGNYSVQLTVVNDRGQVGTQQYPLVVEAGAQPAEIVRDLASAYESLQPSAFLKNFDEERFHNYAGFAAAIEDSFRNKLETMRVFQRPVNCAVVEQQDDGVCQAEFRLQFTLKNQPTELLDAQGNAIPPGTTPPPNARTGKRILAGSEEATIRFHRVNAGWKIGDYSAIVNCPGGDSTTGVNVGSCLLAIGSLGSPSFQFGKVNFLGEVTDLPLGGSLTGSFTVVPMGGFTSSINFSGQGQVGNQSVTVQFSPNPSGPMSTVGFTVFAPTTAPIGVSGPTPFTLVLTGTDTSGAITATTNATLVLQPDFSISLTPMTTSSSPAAVTQNSTLPVTVQIVAGTGFTGTVFIDFPNLPAGFSANSGNLAAGSQGSFPITVSAAASPGPAFITVRGTSSLGVIRTASLFLNVTSDFTLSVTPVTSATNPIGTLQGGTLQVGLQVVPIAGFAGAVVIDFPILPTGFTAAGGNVAAGATVTFPLQNTLQASPTIFQITVRGSFGTSVQTILLFVQVKVTLPIQPPPTPPSALQPKVYGVEPAKLKPGDVVEAKLYGTNLSGVTAVQLSGSGIKAELLQSGPTELCVRLTVDPGLEPGSRLITINAGASKTTASIDVSSDSSASHGQGRTGNSVAHVGIRQRGDLRLTVGGCTGFRLASGAEQSCGGSADLEVSSRGGTVLVLEAEGVRNLGGIPLDQAEGAASGELSSSAALVAGNIYLVRSRHGMAIVRVVQIRGIESVRNAPPAALRGPRLGGSDREVQGNSGRPDLTLVLEWKVLQ